MELLSFNSDEMKGFKAGFFGGFAESIVGQPFDTVRVRQQVFSKQTYNGTALQYTGTVHAFRDIIQKEKIRGLYKGVTSPLFGVLLTNTITFGVQGNVQKRSSSFGIDPDDLLSHAFAGFMAGFAVSTVRSPIEFFRIRMQTQGQGKTPSEYKIMRRYSSPLDCMRQIFHTEGVRGVYRGFVLTAARESTGCAVYFYTYEKLCGTFEPGVKPDGDKGIVNVLVSGGSAGVMSWLINYPVEIVKSKIQADVDHRYKGVVDCCRQTLKEDGLRGFSKGLTTTLVRAFVVNAAIFFAVSSAKKYM